MTRYAKNPKVEFVPADYDPKHGRVADPVSSREIVDTSGPDQNRAGPPLLNRKRRRADAARARRRKP